MFIKPKPGRRVPLPEGGVLPEAGQSVERNQYWLRRIKDGDVEEVKEETQPAVKAEKAGKDQTK